MSHPNVEFEHEKIGVDIPEGTYTCVSEYNVLS